MLARRGILAPLLILGIIAAAQAAGILGEWRGTSTCMDKVAYPACTDEVVVYDVRVGATADRSPVGGCPVPTKAVYVLVVPGFADWEPAHALAELRRHGQYRVEVVALTNDLVPSMGGMMIHPTRTVDAVDLADVAVFIVP